MFWLLLSFFILAPCACFLVLAVAPRLFSQGTQWFTLSYLRQTFTGVTALAIANSLWVSCTAAAFGLAVGFPIAWLAARTSLPGRRLVAGGMWLVLLLPSWLPALGWQRLVQPDGVLYRVGIGAPFITHLIMGPFGVVLLLGLRSVPFTFLAVTAGLAGLGQEFEDAARVHGACAGRAEADPADPRARHLVRAGHQLRRVGERLRRGRDTRLQFQFPARHLPAVRRHQQLPAQLPGRRGDGMAAGGGRGAPAGPAGAGAARPIVRGAVRAQQAGHAAAARPPGTAAAAAGVGLFYLFALGVPGFGAVSGSLLGDLGGSFSLTLTNYRAVFHEGGQIGPLARSLGYGFVTASVTVIGGFIAARLLAQRKTKATRLLDFMLLAAVALPSVVFGAGYIFAYNLPVMSSLGINLYQTVTLLVIAYVASSLPTNARVLVGAVSQIQPSLKDAARAHGAGEVAAWARGVLPAVSRPIVMAWLLTFCGTFLELPLSQLLYAPNNPPASVSINDNLSTYHFGIGMAQSVLAVGIALAAVGVVLGGYRLLAPHGWRRIGGTARG